MLVCQTTSKSQSMLVCQTTFESTSMLAGQTNPSPCHACSLDYHQSLPCLRSHYPQPLPCRLTPNHNPCLLARLPPVSSMLAGQTPLSPCHAWSPAALVRPIQAQARPAPTTSLPMLSLYTATVHCWTLNTEYHWSCGLLVAVDAGPLAAQQ